MASNALTVARNIRVWRDTNLSPQALSRVLAGVARTARDGLIASGDAPANYQTFVDGREGASEDAVRPDGVILYKFNLLGLAAALAVTTAIQKSPTDSGRYRGSWLVLVNGESWVGDLNDIPPQSTVHVTNPQPYARKIDVGHMKMSVPHGIIEATRQVVRRRFPTLNAENIFLTIPKSMGGGYILKGRFRKGIRPNSRRSLRKDVFAGQEMTYPALEITLR